MTTTNDATTWSLMSPKPSAIRQQLPDSPDYSEKYCTNSDDLQPTSDLHASSLVVDAALSSNNVIVGSHEKTVTLGRGGSNTIKIGRRNRQISRTHVSITFSQQNQQFELTVIGLNGACIDNVTYAQHAIAILQNDSFVDVLGEQFHFKIPPPPLNFDNIKDDAPVVINKNTDILREMSPQAEEEEEEEEEQEVVVEEEEQEPIIMEKETPFVLENAVLEQIIQVEEEEEYPQELVPDDVLSCEEKELSPEPVITKKKAEPLQENRQLVEEEDTHDYAEVIIDALGKIFLSLKKSKISFTNARLSVFSRTSSMPISDICSRILKGNPVYAKQPRALWIERIRTVLKEKPFFGEIQRKGKTADGSPTENLYYYNSELDPVEWRRATYTQVGRSARKCTLKDKQYFWKIPPKLGRHRSSYIPPPAMNESKRQRDDQQHHDSENVDPKKTRY